ncbi:class I SAM-dependent methyltransferase [Algihabitans albus]|uniref:class I SAM-dependent methyltransferase n=1 Tax=Algihabitans albus TaxID=2164067 RepID=UPI000E5C7DDB|nr:class I SAM-dependent methyltransferase [Algihabitans albus]
MSPRTIGMSDSLYDYVLKVSLREPEILARLRAETTAGPGGAMQISPEQGQFMQLLAELTGARSYLEVGTFTGYSALAMALALPADAELVCCDVSEDYTNMARRFWDEAGVADRINLRIAPALETLEALQGDGRQFDLMFVDADKENYGAYYEAGLKLVRPGGLLMFDNVLWGGSVADPDKQDADTLAIRALNTALQGDPRVSLSLVPIGDGLTLARRR